MEDAIAIGRFGKPYGVKGWIKVISYTDPIDNILHYLPWFIIKDHDSIKIEQVNAKVHQGGLIVKLAQCESPEDAKTYTNLEIEIPRKQLPQLETEEEFYWIDLVGLTVINQSHECLGIVEKVFATGSNDVLVVRDDEGKERLIPYTKDAIIEVNLNEKRIRVDWDLAF